jgi:hypothetical protein
MLHRNERVSRLLSRFTLLFLVASPAPPVVAAVEESGPPCIPIRRPPPTTLGRFTATTVGG